MYGWHPKERKKELFRRVGNFGPKDESVNCTVSRLEVLIDKCRKADIRLTMEMRLFLLKEVVPESARALCVLADENEDENDQRRIALTTA